MVWVAPLQVFQDTGGNFPFYEGRIGSVSLLSVQVYFQEHIRVLGKARCVNGQRKKALSAAVGWLADIPSTVHSTLHLHLACGQCIHTLMRKRQAMQVL